MYRNVAGPKPLRAASAYIHQIVERRCSRQFRGCEAMRRRPKLLRLGSYFSSAPIGGLRRLPRASPVGLPYFVAYLLPWSSWHILLGKVHPFLQVGVRDVEHLHVGVHRLLHHLLERLLLLLSLLLEHLLLLLGLLHPLLYRLLEGLLLLFGLLRGVRTRSAQELHISVHQLLHHLLGVLLLLLNLLCELLHLAKPFPSAFWCLHSPFSASLSHCFLLPPASPAGNAYT